MSETYAGHLAAEQSGARENRAVLWILWGMAVSKTSRLEVRQSRTCAEIFELCQLALAQGLHDPAVPLLGVVLRPPLHAIERLRVFGDFVSVQRIDRGAEPSAASAPGLERQVGRVWLGGHHKHLASLLDLLFPAVRLPHRAEAIVPAQRATHYQ